MFGGLREEDDAAVGAEFEGGELIMSDWLQNLKAGDEVIVRRGLGHTRNYISTIDKVTPTQIVIGESRYNRTTGRRRGDTGWNSANLVEPTREALAIAREAARRELYTAKLRTMNWAALPADALEAILTMIKNAEQIKEEISDESHRHHLPGV